MGKIIGEQAPNGKRTKLANVLPLETPFIVQIFDIYACNLACKFCHYGLPEKERPLLTTKPIMDLSLFKKIIDDLKEFPEKIKMLRFCGAGESLLDPNIVEMISYAVSSNVAEKIELITNGILLTSEMSKKLLEAGLERIKISIYGMSSEKYEEISQRKVKFEDIVNNIKLFYNLRNEGNYKTRIYVKTMDCCLKSSDEMEDFISLFGDYCDYYALEHVMPSVVGVDYSEWLEGGTLPGYNTMGVKLPDIKICPQPYHLITIRPDGKIIPCQKEYMDEIGDVNSETLYNIWNCPNGKLKKFQKMMLEGNKNCGEICSECKLAQCRPFPEDILDNDIERLKKLF